MSKISYHDNCNVETTICRKYLLVTTLISRTRSLFTMFPFSSIRIILQEKEVKNVIRQLKCRKTHGCKKSDQTPDKPPSFLRHVHRVFGRGPFYEPLTTLNYTQYKLQSNSFKIVISYVMRSEYSSTSKIVFKLIHLK